MHWLLFVLQVLIIAVVLWMSGRLSPVAQYDTTSYIEFSTRTFIEALNDRRTFVYPTFLQLVQSSTQSYAIVPIIQFGCAVCAAATFLYSLMRCEWNRWLALAAGSSLLYGQLVFEYTFVLTPDLLAQSLSVIAISAWLMFVHRGGGLGNALALGSFVFLAYQTKPAYLFLMGFVPVGGGIARWWLYHEARDAGRVAFKLLLIAVCPFLMWSALRWTTVGHFGLVSYGGYNIIGITAHLLDEPLIDELSQQSQPLARAILARRNERTDFIMQIDYPTIEPQYNGMAWEVAAPAAESLYANQTLKMNEAMSQLSKEIIMHRPRLYWKWLMAASKHAISEALHLTITNVGVLASLAMALLMHAYMGWPRKKVDVETTSSGDRSRLFSREFQTIVWLAIGYSFCNFALVILVEPPISRYSAAATVFWPCLIPMMFMKYAMVETRVTQSS